MARKRKINVKVEKVSKKDEQLSEEDLKKVSGGSTPITKNPTPPPTPDIDCWKPKA